MAIKYIKSGTPVLTKYCSKDHNIRAGCNSLRIGTLYGFREEENALLRDEGEGSFSYRISFPDYTPVPDSWVNEFSTIVGTAFEPDMKITDGQAHIKSLTIDGGEPNAWIYCTSMGISNVSGSLSTAHTDSWNFPMESAKNFLELLIFSLSKTSTLEDIPEHERNVISFGQFLNEFKLEGKMGPVEYVDRNLSISSVQEFPISEIKKLKERIPFMKPKRFKDENEFRMVIRLFIAGRQISVPIAARIIGLRPIDSVIKF